MGDPTDGSHSIPLVPAGQALVLTCHAGFVDQLRAAATAAGNPEPNVINL